MKAWVHKGINGVKGYYIRPRLIALLYALTVFTGLLVIWLYMGTLIERRLSQEERALMSNRVYTIGTSLTLAVNQRLSIVTSVRSFVEAEVRRDVNFNFDGAYETEEITGFVSGLYAHTAGIRNIAVAPDGVMQFVFPYEANKAVLGYNPARDERSFVRQEVQRAIQSGDIVLSLPYNLIQGGQGLIARQAIFVDGHYWGLANVVLDVPPLLEESALSPMPAGLDLAVKDQAGTVFYGSEHVFSRGPVTYIVKLPEGNWILAAIPSTGWGAQYKSIVWFYRVTGLISIITIPLLAYLFIHRRERLAYLVDQRTQELAQSNQTLITVLEGINADVYVADFDTHEILFANKHLRESFQDDLVDKRCFEAFRHEAQVCAHCKNNLLLDEQGEPRGVLVWEDRNPITKRWYNNADRAIRWQDGRYVHLQIANDITAQKQALETIRESEERYRIVVEHAFDGIYLMHGYHYEYVNEQFCKITGYPRETLCSQEFDYRKLLTEKNRESVHARFQARLDGTEIPSTYETEIVTRSGVVRTVEISTTAMGANGHQPRILGFIRDITERKQANEELKKLVMEKDILLAEVHHRVKNNMQVISSLLGLQAGELQDDRLSLLYEESRNRIRSMTLVHEQLYRSKEYAHIEFGVYIDHLATSLFTSYQINPEQVRLNLVADDIYLDLDRAIPCGLLINELITNSLKYAFPDGRVGKISIELHMKAGELVLEYNDDGVGFPASFDLENAQSLGLQLVRLLVVHDLHGKIMLKREHGTQYRIEIPIPGLKES